MKDLLDIKVQIRDDEALSEVEPGLIVMYLQDRGWHVVNDQLRYCDIWELKPEYAEHPLDEFRQLQVPRLKGNCDDYSAVVSRIIWHLEDKYKTPQLRLLWEFTSH